MSIPVQIITIADFERYTKLPENGDKVFEFIAGEVVEVPSNPYVSKIATLISLYIGMYLLQHDLGHLTGEAGGYIVAGERYAPDVAFISYEKQAELPKSGYNPNPPDLAVEVVSSDSKAEMTQLRIKISNYLSVGTVVWLVQPDTQHIEVHAPNQAVKIYRQTDILDGGTVFADFQLPMSKIFPLDESSA